MKLSRFGISGTRADAPELRQRLVDALTSAGAELVTQGPADFLLQLDDSPADFGCEVWQLSTASPGPLGFWDVYDGAFHLEIRLVAGARPLERRYLQVDRLSYTRTLERVVEEMVEMVVHVARCGPPESVQPVAFPSALYDSPTAWERLRLKAKLLTRFAAEQWRGIFFAEAWMVGVIEAPVSEFLDMGYQPGIEWLPSPTKQRFLADPFLVKRPDGWLLLAEDFDFDTNLGRIVHEFSSDSKFTGAVQDALAEPCHMSYPFPLEHEGALYCIPETHQLNGVYAWRWDDISRSWKDKRRFFPGWRCSIQRWCFTRDAGGCSLHARKTGPTVNSICFTPILYGDLGNLTRAIQ